MTGIPALKKIPFPVCSYIFPVLKRFATLLNVAVLEKSLARMPEYSVKLVSLILAVAGTAVVTYFSTSVASKCLALHN